MYVPPPRCGLNSNVLSFRAKMMATDPVNTKRVFIISFYLCDDSISVFERPQKNSGINVWTKAARKIQLWPSEEKSMTLMVNVKLSDSASTSRTLWKQMTLVHFR